MTYRQKKPSTVHRRTFTETRWSQILLAGQGDPQQAQKAKETLCALYWSPIYAFLLRKGHTHHDAEDLTQQFFVRLLESDAFAHADQAKGRFRSFLLGALKHFLADEARKASRQKRGGNVAFIPMGVSDSEQRRLLEPAPGLTPEQAYHRRWATTLLDLAFQRLRADFEAADQTDRFEALKPFLSEEAHKGDYEDVSHSLGMTPKAVSMAVHRMRQRYRQLVRQQVADTLVDARDVEEEWRDLFR